MPNEKNKRPVKYIRRKKETEKSFSSVRSLVTKITGVSENRDEEFDAAYKEVQRIVKTMQIFVDNKGRLKVSPDFEDGMVFLTKAFLPTGPARDLYDKIRLNQRLSEDEQIKLTNLFKGATKLNKNSPENDLLLQRTQAEEEFMSLMDEIREIMLNDIDLADSVTHHTERVRLLKNYRDHLVQSLNEWRVEVADVKKNEAILLKLIEIGLEKGYGADDLHENMKPEVLQELMKELVLRDSVEIINRIKAEKGW